MAKKRTVPDAQEGLKTTERNEATAVNAREVKKGKVGAGWRYCAECDHSTKGTRDNPACAKCGHPFPEKTPAKKTASVPLHQKTLDFGETLEVLAKVKKYAEDFGGVEKFRRMLESFDDIQVQTGGIEGLRKALDALKTL